MSTIKKTASISGQCVACGACIKACPISAMSVYKGLYAVADYKKCIGCGKCVLACPAHVISLIPKEDSL